MKKLMSFGAIALFALSIASCKTCYDCTSDLAGNQELCSGDGVSKSELEDAVAALEATPFVGFECTKQ
jgi:hypothetical protein